MPKQKNIENSEVATKASHDRYGFAVGDAVVHIREQEADQGILIEIDADHDLGDVTTCRVMWGCSSLEEALSHPREDSDIVWTNKLVVASKSSGNHDVAGASHG